MSSKSDPSLPAVGLNVREGRENLWAKTKQAHLYLYKNHLHEADWFLKADDDTYVVVENLRYMLQSYNHSEALYFGCKFKPYVKQGYMSGGAGYVLSKEAVIRFASKGLQDKSGITCRTDDGGAEDVEMGKCMEGLGVKAGDSRLVPVKRLHLSLSPPLSYFLHSHFLIFVEILWEGEGSFLSFLNIT